MLKGNNTENTNKNTFPAATRSTYLQCYRGLVTYCSPPAYNLLLQDPQQRSAIIQPSTPTLLQDLIPFHREKKERKMNKVNHSAVSFVYVTSQPSTDWDKFPFSRICSGEKISFCCEDLLRFYPNQLLFLRDVINLPSKLVLILNV